MPERENDVHDQAADPKDLEEMAAWEPPVSPGSLRAIIPHKWLRRFVVGAIPVLAFAFGSGIIFVSQMDVVRSLRVFGDREKGRVGLEPGGRASLRIAIWNSQGRRYESGFRVTVRLRGRDKKTHRLFRGDAGRAKVVVANFSVPRLPLGRAELVVSAEQAGRRFQAKLRASLLAPGRAPPARELPRAKDDPGARKRPYDTQGVAFELLPSGGRKIVAQLRERIVVRAIDRQGRGRIASTHLILKRGRLSNTRVGGQVVPPFTTDVLGLHLFGLVSRHPMLELGVTYRAKKPDGTAHGEERLEWPFGRRPALAMLTPAQLVVRPGARIPIVARTVARSGLLHFDLFAGGRRREGRGVKVTKRGVAEVSFTAPTRAGLIRVQASDEHDAASTTLAIRTLFVDAQAQRVPTAESLRRLAGAVRKKLGDEPRTKRHLDWMLAENAFAKTGVNYIRTAEYLLSRLDRQYHATHTVADTVTAAKARLKKRKAGLQGWLVLGLAFTAFLLLCLVVPMILTNLMLAKRGAEERAALMATADEHAPADPEPSQRLDRVRHVIQAVVVVGVIILLAAMIVLLLTNLTWGLDF